MMLRSLLLQAHQHQQTAAVVPAAAAAAAAAATATGSAVFSRAAHSAAAAAADELPTTSSSSSHTAAPASAASASERGLPPPGVYGVRIKIKAHELRFVKAASTAIQDLVLLNFAPKAADTLPPGWRPTGGTPWVNLVMPLGATSLPVRRSHFTVISGPHVHKYAREQYARTTHTRVVKAATNNLGELQWLLDAIKMYNFIGCEIAIRVTSSSYLLPTSSSQQEAAQRPLLSEHMQRFDQLFGAAAPAGSATSPSSSSSSSRYGELQSSLRELRDSLSDGLLQQRMQLAVNSSYERFTNTAEGSRAALAAAAAAATGSSSSSSGPRQLLQEAVARQVEGSSLQAPGAGVGEGQEPASRQQALLAAIDRAFLSLKTDVLDRQRLLPFLMAFVQPGGQQQVPPAEWMQAVLQFGKQRQQQAEGSAEGAALQAYQQAGAAGRALLMLMLQQWYTAADAAQRQRMALPGAAQVDVMLGINRGGSSSSGGGGGGGSGRSGGSSGGRSNGGGDDGSSSGGKEESTQPQAQPGSDT